MNTIHFSHSWNRKLDQDIFTTIRKYDYGKWNYYKSAEGNKFGVFLNKVKIGEARLLQAEYEKLMSLPNALLCFDTGMELQDAYKLFRKFGIDKQDMVIVLTFKKEDIK